MNNLSGNEDDKSDGEAQITTITAALSEKHESAEIDVKDKADRLLAKISDDKAPANDEMNQYFSTTIGAYMA